MDSVLVEHTEDGKKAYKSLIVEPAKLSVLNSPLALEIVKELTREQGCALDIARNLQLDEQKVYYYMRKLEQAGIVKLARTEKRHGMTAKIYDVIAPIIATKLHDDGYDMLEGKVVHDPDLLRFMSPFVEKGKLNALIVIGDPYSHGRFDKASHEGPYAFDFALLLGKFIKQDLQFPNYKLDTEVTKEDLKKNLILIGNMKSNVVIDRMNDKIPIYFDTKKDFRVLSKFTGNSYKDPRIGVVMKFDNPFNKGKKVIIIGGIGSRGSRSSVIAFTQRFHDLIENQENGNIFRIVRGLDRSGNRVIDDIEILE